MTIHPIIDWRCPEAIFGKILGYPNGWFQEDLGTIFGTILEVFCWENGIPNRIFVVLGPKYYTNKFMFGYRKSCVCAVPGPKKLYNKCIFW